MSNFFHQMALKTTVHDCNNLLVDIQVFLTMSNNPRFFGITHASLVMVEISNISCNILEQYHILKHLYLLAMNVSGYICIVLFHSLYLLPMRFPVMGCYAILNLFDTDIFDPLKVCASIYGTPCTYVYTYLFIYLLIQQNMLARTSACSSSLKRNKEVLFF